MEQQLKFNILTGVIGSEKIDQLKNKVEGIPAAGGRLNQLGGNIGALATKIGLYGAAIFGAYKTIEQGLDQLIQGEKVNAINAQFENLANGAGLAANEISSALIAATDGLIDDEDAIQLATKNIVALGSQASRLPQIMEVARSASKTLGTDLKDTFGNLAGFIENGNAKALKQYGLVLDISKAYDNAAKAVGITASQLTEAQQQQIRLNLLIDEAPKKFNKAADSVTPLADALARIKVTTGNILEDFSSGIAEGAARILVDKSDLSNVGDTRLNKRYEETTEEVKKLESALKNLNRESFGQGVDAAAKYALTVSDIKKRLAEAREEAQKLMIEASGRSDAELFAALDASRTKKPDVKIELTDEQKAEQAKKYAEERKKVTDQLKRETDAIEKFKAVQSEQINIEKMQIDGRRLSTVELEKNMVALRLRSQTERESANFTKENKAAMAEATEEIIKQKQALIELEERQKGSFAVGAENAFKRYLENVRNVSAQSDLLFTNAIGNMEDALLGFFRTGELNLKAFADEFINQLIRMQIRQATAGIYGSIGNFFSGGASLGAPSAPIDGGIGIDSGVSVAAATAKLGVSSKTLSTTQSSSQPIYVNVTVNADGTSEQNGSQLGLAFAEPIIGIVKKVLIDEKRPGGLLSV